MHPHTLLLAVTHWAEHDIPQVAYLVLSVQLLVHSPECLSLDLHTGVPHSCGLASRSPLAALMYNTNTIQRCNRHLACRNTCELRMIASHTVLRIFIIYRGSLCILKSSSLNWVWCEFVTDTCKIRTSICVQLQTAEWQENVYTALCSNSTMVVQVHPWSMFARLESRRKGYIAQHHNDHVLIDPCFECLDEGHYTCNMRVLKYALNDSDLFSECV